MIMETQVSSILTLCYPQQRISVSWLKVVAPDPAIMSASQSIERGEGRSGGLFFPCKVMDQKWHKSLLLTSHQWKFIPFHTWMQIVLKNVVSGEIVNGLAKTQRLNRQRKKEGLAVRGRPAILPQGKARSIDPCIESCLEKAYFILNTHHFVFRNDFTAFRYLLRIQRNYWWLSPLMWTFAEEHFSAEKLKTQRTTKSVYTATPT